VLQIVSTDFGSKLVVSSKEAAEQEAEATDAEDYQEAE